MIAGDQKSVTCHMCTAVTWVTEHVTILHCNILEELLYCRQKSLLVNIGLYFLVNKHHIWDRAGQKLSRVEENVEQMSVGSRMAASRREEGRMRGQRWSRRRCNRTPELIACPANKRFRYRLSDILLPADTSADVSENILFGTSWERSQLRGKSRVGSEGRAQTRRGKGESKFPGVG